MPNKFLTAADWEVKYDNYFISVEHRVLSNATPGENGCIEYGAGKLKHKYGLVCLSLRGGPVRVPAHRALWMAVHRNFALPGSIYIRHKCDNPCCVNISHLVAGTPKDNAQDCIQKERRARKHKTHTRQRKFSDEQISAIRNATGKVKWVAEEFGTTPGYVSKLRSGKAKPLVK